LFWQRETFPPCFELNQFSAYVKAIAALVAKPVQ
jgi:hypothetical protein